MEVIMKNGMQGELNFEEKEGAAVFRHTASHILAQAVKRLYPDAKLAIGPAIDDGFYYDFDFSSPISSDDFAAIEKEMKKIVKERLKLERFTLPREEALALMKEKKEDYKVALIEDLPEDAVISFYRQGDFVDLCAGPHLADTGYVKAIKLTSLAGAYWRGNEKNKMLTRIYGTSFPDKEQLAAYLERMEEAKKRDHRKLGKELGLFTLMEEGPGFPFFLPKGMILKNTLVDYWRKLHEREGYQEISTPKMCIRDRVYNSVIGCGVTVGKDTVIRDSIIMNNTVIGSHCELNKAIIAENVLVGDNVKMGVGDEADNDIAPHIYNSGIVTVGEKSTIPTNVQIGKNTVIFGETDDTDYQAGTLASGKSLIKAGDEN